MSYMKVAGMLDIPAHRIKPESFTHKNIVKLYGKVTRETVIAYDDRCNYLVNLLNSVMSLKLISTREITDKLYGEHLHVAVTHNCLLRNNNYYETFKFLGSRTYDNLERVESLLRDKKNTIEKLLGESNESNS